MRLPSPPGVALQVLSLCRQDDAQVYELANVIGMDPALSARLLRFANSPAMGIGRQVSSVREAVLLLGLRAVKLLSLGFSLLSEDFKPRSPSFDIKRFWHKSFLRATVSRGLAARFIDMDKEEAFVAGLLSTIGQLAQAVSSPIEYESVLQAVRRGAPLLEAENSQFGVDHIQFGAQLLADWELPESIVQAVLTQKSQEVDSSDPPLTIIMDVAPKLACVMLQGEAATAEVIESARRGVQDILCIDDNAWQVFAQDMMRDFREVADIFGIELAEGSAAPDLISEAREEAIRIGMLGQFEQTRLARSHDDLLRKATTDPLTGIANRAKFSEKLNEAIQKLNRGIDPFGILLYDLDHFKRVNDTFGHQFGDQVLCEVTRAVQAVLRNIDTLARYGGEEFVILLPKVDKYGLCTVAHRILQNVESLKLRTGSETVTVTISAGIVLTADYTTIPNAEMLLQDADTQLYLSKKAGRNTWHYRDKPSDVHQRGMRWGFLSKALAHLSTGR